MKNMYKKCKTDFEKQIERDTRLNGNNIYKYWQ